MNVLTETWATVQTQYPSVVQKNSIDAKLKGSESHNVLV